MLIISHYLHVVVALFFFQFNFLTHDFAVNCCINHRVITLVWFYFSFKIFSDHKPSWNISVEKNSIEVKKNVGDRRQHDWRREMNYWAIIENDGEGVGATGARWSLPLYAAPWLGIVGLLSPVTCPRRVITKSTSRV